VQNRASWFLTKAILINGKTLNIPSYQVKEGDVVSIREKAKAQLRIQNSMGIAAQRSDVEWVDVNTDKKEGVFKRVPDRADLPADINENLIVELYSK